ncbi:MAG: S1 RNA-binding domain-containing protein, partial [Planctomycetota bacterium]|nr:S1 RNA-binding domain-containing protein [Planctomycetota bacterium]
REFGAFLEILPGRDGLCHVSEISSGYIDNVADLIRVGDEFAVQVIEVDDHGRIKLSRRRALEELGEEDPLAEQIQKMSEGRGDRGEGRGDRGEGRGDRGEGRGDRGDRGRRGDRGDGGDRSGGRRRQSRGGGGGGGRRS